LCNLHQDYLAVRRNFDFMSEFATFSFWRKFLFGYLCLDHLNFLAVIFYRAALHGRWQVHSVLILFVFAWFLSLFACFLSIWHTDCLAWCICISVLKTYNSLQVIVAMEISSVKDVSRWGHQWKILAHAARCMRIQRWRRLHHRHLLRYCAWHTFSY
jgi:hypothetical protein